MVNMAPNHRPSPFADFDQAAARLHELASAAESLPEPDRGTYYRQLCGSTLAVINQRRAPCRWRLRSSGFFTCRPIPLPMPISTR